MRDAYYWANSELAAAQDDITTGTYNLLTRVHTWPAFSNHTPGDGGSTNNSLEAIHDGIHECARRTSLTVIRLIKFAVTSVAAVRWVILLLRVGVVMTLVYLWHSRIGLHRLRPDLLPSPRQRR